MISRAAYLLALAAVACSNEEEGRTASAAATDVPAPLIALAQDALRAAAEVKISGNIDSVLRAHPLSPRYRQAMGEQLALMKKLYDVAQASRLNYPAYELRFAPAESCSSGDEAKLLLRGVARFTMEPVPPNVGTPPYTAATEEHIFEFVRTEQGWTVSRHHEISLAEMHHPSVDRLRHPCATES